MFLDASGLILDEADLERAKAALLTEISSQTATAHERPTGMDGADFEEPWAGHLGAARPRTPSEYPDLTVEALGEITAQALDRLPN